MVVEAGNHTLSDGTVLVAGNQDGQKSNWLNYNLGDAFAPSVRPVVFSQIVSLNDRAAATTRMRFTSDSEFQIKILEQEANIQDHSAETVSFIAIQPGIGTSGGSLFQAVVTPDSVTHNNYFRNDQLQLSGAVEVQQVKQTEKTSYQSAIVSQDTIDSQDTPYAELKSIDNAFENEFDRLV